MADNKGTFIPRLNAPESGNIYYTFTSKGGIARGVHADLKWYAWSGSTVPNCVGYAWGRWNEIAGEGKWKYIGNGNANMVIANAVEKHRDWVWSPTPTLGAFIAWDAKGERTCGHIAVVEQIHPEDGSITISESGYSFEYPKYWQTKRIYPGKVIYTDEETEISLYSWNYKTATTINTNLAGYGNCLGFLCFPGTYSSSTLSYVDLGNRGFSGGAGNLTFSSYASKWDNTELQKRASEYENFRQKYNTKVVLDTINFTKNTEASKTFNEGASYQGMDLLTSNSLVEVPYITATIGDYRFGSYTDTVKQGTHNVDIPNYLNSLNIVKVNGSLNTYTLGMTYQIAPGQDPNLIDKILSKVSDSRKIVLSYGDYAAPASMQYREEEAIITKVDSKISFQESKIDYTLYCTSKALEAAATTRDFPAIKRKISDYIINMLLKEDSWGYSKVFSGNINAIRQGIIGNLIATDDQVVEVESKRMDPIKYLSYLVSCMRSSDDRATSTIKSATYHLVIMDDLENEYGGSYFKIVKINTNARNMTSENVYSVNIGFPSSAAILNFDVTNNTAWSILYNYSGKVTENNKRYKIDKDGNVQTIEANSIAVSANLNKITEEDATWWTKMTQFPITASLKIKGLLRPAVLMSYVKINAYFYGQKSVTSGLYVITKQEDEVNSNGYSTTLSLNRMAGDNDETANYSQSLTKEKINTQIDSEYLRDSNAIKDSKGYST